MKTIRLFFVLLLLSLIAITLDVSRLQADEDVKTLRVLSIGNSFSVCLNGCFQPVVESVPGCRVEWDHLTIGGCSLEQHWKNIAKEEAEPGYKYFKRFTYKEKLRSKKWDIVSIQQASHLSWNYKTYMPYLKELHDYIKTNAPQAEVVIQQTWSYRPDEKRMKTWGLDQNTMFEKIADAYHQAALEINARILPVGYALQLARKSQPGGYKGFNPDDYKAPDLPDISRFFTGTVQWNKEQTAIVGDAFHLNQRGRYLQACVWFAVLFNRSATDVTYLPPKMNLEDARFIREMAQKAVDEFEQVKKQNQ